MCVLWSCLLWCSPPRSLGLWAFGCLQGSGPLDHHLEPKAACVPALACRSGWPEGWCHLWFYWLLRWLKLWRIRLPMQEMQVQSLGWEDPMEEEMATHSSILAWQVTWTDRGVWQATVHGVAESQTWLSDWAHTYAPVFIKPSCPGFSHFSFTVSSVPHIDSLVVFLVPSDISEHQGLCFFLYTIFLDELKYSHNFNHLY